MLTLQYVISGGQLQMEKTAFARELLQPEGPIKMLMSTKNPASGHQPKLVKTGDQVILNFNDSAEIYLDEGFYDLFKKLKVKYQGKIKGSVVIRITALTSYYVTLNFNSDDDRVVYE